MLRVKLNVLSNHATFYYNQVASLQMLSGNDDAARTALQQYFSGAFQDQIDISGEQPNEAKRTRPFHYRCFNIEAMIVGPFFSGQSYGHTLMTRLDQRQARCRVGC